MDKISTLSAKQGRQNYNFQLSYFSEKLSSDGCRSGIFPENPGEHPRPGEKKNCRLPAASLIEVFIACAAVISPARQAVDTIARLDARTVRGREDHVSAPDHNEPEASRWRPASIRQGVELAGVAPDRAHRYPEVNNQW